MKTKILFICCFILLLCGCSKEKEVEEELLTDNDFGFSILLDDGLALDKGLQIKSINDYIGDEYEETKKNNNKKLHKVTSEITSMRVTSPFKFFFFFPFY